MEIEKNIVIASTFTAEPIKDSIQYWLETLGMTGQGLAKVKLDVVR